jgi:hypothetical protein
VADITLILTRIAMLAVVLLTADASASRPAAVDLDGLTGDITSGVGGEPEHSADYVLRGTFLR